jgi:hypothetical protein
MAARGKLSRVSEGCPFCERIATREVSRARGSAVAFDDSFPVSEGHTLVVPVRHEPNFQGLSPAEREDVWSLVADVQSELTRLNGIENLVFAHDKCNNYKSAYLASEDHVERWLVRMTGEAKKLSTLAESKSWESHPRRILSRELDHPGRLRADCHNLVTSAIGPLY